MCDSTVAVGRKYEIGAHTRRVMEMKPSATEQIFGSLHQSLPRDLRDDEAKPLTHGKQSYSTSTQQLKIYTYELFL